MINQIPVCPYCDSLDLEYLGTVDGVDGPVWNDMGVYDHWHCNQCAKEWHGQMVGMKGLMSGTGDDGAQPGVIAP